MAGDEITEEMHEAAKRAAAAQISEGIGAILRKFCDSAHAKKAREHLHAMPEGDWTTLICMLAEEASHAALEAVAPMIARAAYWRGQVDMRPDQIGPRAVVTKRTTCEGCPSLHTKKWREYLPEDDEHDSGTTATCLSLPGTIDVYWHSGTPVPEWCPAIRAIPTGAPND